MADTDITLNLNLKGSETIKSAFNQLTKSLTTITKINKDSNTRFKTTAKIFQQISLGAKKVKDSFAAIRKAGTNAFATARNSAKKLGSSFKNIGKSVFSLRGLVVGLGAAFTLNKIIEAAKVQEDAINQLEIALKSSGLTAKGTSEEFQKFASELQQSTKFGDETILGITGLIQSLGQLDKDGLKKATSATLDLSAAMGIDLNAAAILVGKAAAGQVSSLSRYGLVVEKGANKTETFANALDAINKQFGGAAAGQVKTFSGATQQLSNTFGDLLEELGFLITRSPIVIQVVNEVNKIFGKLGTGVKENRKEIIQFVGTGINILLKGFEFALDGIDSLIKGFQRSTTIADKVTQGIEFLSQKYLEFVVTINRARISLNDFLGDQEDVSSITKQNEALEQQISFIKKSIAITQDEIDAKFGAQNKLIDKVKDVSAQIRDTINKNLKETGEITLEIKKSPNNKKVINDTLKQLLDADKKISASTTKRLKKERQEFQKRQEEQLKRLSEFRKELSQVGAVTVADPFKALTQGLDEFKKKLTKEEKIKLKLEIDQAEFVQTIGIATGFSNKILKGAEGAKELLITGASAALDTIVPGLGAAVGPLLDAFAQGPEKVREMVRQFVKSLPIFINAIISSVPVFIQEIINGVPLIIESILSDLPRLVNLLIDSVPRIIDTLVDNIPKIISAWVENIPSIVTSLSLAMPLVATQLALAMPDVALSLAAEMPFVALSFLKGIAGGFKNIGDVLSRVFNNGAKKLFDGIVGAVKNFGKGMRDAVKNLVSSLVSGAGQFVKNIISGAGDFVNKLIEKLPGGKLLTGGGGGIGGGAIGSIVGGAILGPVGAVAGAIGGALGFAEGGEVPAGFPNDTFPARLSSHEGIIRSDLNPRLKSFLDRNESSSSSSSNSLEVLLVRILDLLERPMQTTASVELNDRTFAEILLTLDRNNARVAV